MILIPLGEREAKVVIDRTASDVDQVKRSSSRKRVRLNMHAQPFFQGANCDKTFVDGSRHQILPQITTSHATLVTREQQSGSFREVSFENGSRLVLCCGFTGSVRSFLFPFPIYSHRRLSLIAGSGKSILWFVVPKQCADLRCLS